MHFHSEAAGAKPKIPCDLFTIAGGQRRINRRAADEIVLPGHLVGGVRLRLGTRAEPDAGDAVATHDRHAVGREGPLAVSYTHLA